MLPEQPLALAGLAATGSLHAYWKQVWEFGSLYSRDTFVQNPAPEGVVRSLNWLGFHLALVVPAAIALIKEKGTTRFRFGIWLCLAAVGVWAGERYFPRYYLILVPPVTLLAARGLRFVKWMVPESERGTKRYQAKGHFTQSGTYWVHNGGWLFYGCLALLLIPMIRFGPRYVLLAEDLVSGGRINGQTSR